MGTDDKIMDVQSVSVDVPASTVIPRYVNEGDTRKSSVKSMSKCKDFARFGVPGALLYTSTSDMSSGLGRESDAVPLLRGVRIG